ncbi:hypothetical protein KSF_054660 [Reticulibacter mediterranei]|uniref:histidine kinase n=1 Tax=Reticulibacter mediterranei TaxID=2778369 RepID=A0A8J3IKE9_9CHLR|nr:ATP-binding protein [Reticulibacter mediterranei]GHO95418.1 hypothetical protein KSF_054660 [Reticulibacter mediterranei]
MSSRESLPPFEVRTAPRWQHSLLDSVLACSGCLLVTAAIAFWHLYPRIPNISIVYLLVIVGLASTRGRYSAILASVVAFLSFDFFIVPPVYTFVVYRIEEWIALFVFLVDALITSQLTVVLRRRAEQATQREHETHILYDLIRLTTHENSLEQQLHTITQAVVDVFSSWGIRDCVFLQPDQTGAMCVRSSAPHLREESSLSFDELAIAQVAMAHGRIIDLSNSFPSVRATLARFTHRLQLSRMEKGGTSSRSCLFIPLSMGQQVIGVIRLGIMDAAQHFLHGERPEEVPKYANASTAFFWAFLDQATALIEWARLRHENLSIELLQRTDALRAALLSSVSHDLRTPLTAIKASASSLLQEDVQWDEEVRRGFASSIEREVDRLNRLVGNLLDLSRIEDGALKPDKDRYPLPPLIYEVLDRLQPQLQGRVVQAELPTDLPPVELDYVMMDQVLTNLIENAVRYTPPVTPIEIRAQRSGDEIRLFVADRGSGIAPADRERIFDKFYRVLDKEHEDYSPAGSGLGLAVCRGIVEAHHGRIWATAREGGGTVFTIVLPIGSRERILL